MKFGKHKVEHHPHLRSYVGQARIGLHSAVRQLELAQSTLPVPSEHAHIRIQIEDLLDALRPLHERLIQTHEQVVEYTS